MESVTLKSLRILFTSEVDKILVAGNKCVSVFGFKVIFFMVDEDEAVSICAVEFTGTAIRWALVVLLLGDVPVPPPATTLAVLDGLDVALVFVTGSSLGLGRLVYSVSIWIVMVILTP